ncbi:MAG: LuxR C-terminal-related transcriptional regulator [Myxococcota bacterium]
MSRVKHETAAINFVEAAYDLELPPREWLAKIVDSGATLIDGMEKACATIWSGQTDAGEPLVSEVYASPKFPDLPMRFAMAVSDVPREEFAYGTRHLLGRVGVFSEHRDKLRHTGEAYMRHVGCKDSLAMFACDLDGRGVNITIPSQEIIKLTPAARERWDRLAVHLAAGHRLRTALQIGESTKEPILMTQLPLVAEAVIDPKKFNISHAEREAKHKTAGEAIRKAARAVDRARGRLRKTDPNEALSLWRGLVVGRWSLVDWFDSDGRRYLLAKPNAPNCGDPRGLSESELQVAIYLARGESQKHVSYRFGLTEARVSQLLQQVKRKLKVQTRAELVQRFYPERLMSEPDQA